MSKTGFYRVFVTDDGKYFKYQVRNKLIKKEITRKDIYKLKQAVEEAGLLWGIVDVEKAQQYSQHYKLECLQGRYGIKIGGNYVHKNS